MTNLIETPTYEAGIYQLEVTDPYLGGTPAIVAGVPTTGWANAQAQQLANRTAYLNISKLSSEDLAAVVDVSKGAASVGRGWQAASSISEVRDLVKTKPSKYVAVAGYYSAGDGGGGLYYLDATDTTSPDNGGSIIVASDGGRWKLNHTGILSVKQFGARGNGSSNDVLAIQATINSLPTWPTQPCGGAVFFPTGRYLVDAPVVAPVAVRLQGPTGNYNAFLQASASFVGEAVVIFKNTTGANYTADGVGISRMRISGTNKACHGVVAYAPRDNFRFEDVFIEGINGGYSAMKIMGTLSGFLSGAISQSGVFDNCTLQHEDATATEPTFYAERLQEATFTNFKVFGGKANVKAASVPIHLRDCRGVTFNGSTSAFSLSHGILVEGVTRFCIGFTFEGHNFEGVDGASLKTLGTAAQYIQGVSLLNPRYEGSTVKAAELTYTSRSFIEGNDKPVELLTGSQFNRVIVKDPGQYINTGGLANQPLFYSTGPSTWTITNTGAVRSFDTLTITLPDLAKAVSSLVADLRATGKVL